MTDRHVVIVFRCPTCQTGFELRVTDLTVEQQRTITAACGNKHPKLVPMERMVVVDA